MTNAELNTLKEILAIPTRTHEEGRLIKWILTWCWNRNIVAWVDKHQNVYAVKGELAEGEYFPCVIAHTDSVHEIRDMEIEEVACGYDTILRARDPKNGLGIGLGGDDKAGVFIALRLFEQMKVLKGAFFMGEECGCIGSGNLDESFFTDVGWAMEFDSPCDTIMSFSCDGTQLFPTEGKFYDILLETCRDYRIMDWQHHPYTDASRVKRACPFPCLNLPAGYFNMHTAGEYVSVLSVNNTTAMAITLLHRLGRKFYEYRHDSDGERREWMESAEPLDSPDVPVTYLRCESHPKLFPQEALLQS